MTQTLLMISHKNYNLNANESFVIFYFQINYMIYWRCHFENEILVNCVFTK